MPALSPGRRSKASLLDCLYLPVGCMYLSDLKQPCFWKVVRAALARVPPEDFPPGDWADALDYLTGLAPPQRLTAAQARRLLLEELARPPEQDGSGERIYLCQDSFNR